MRISESAGRYLWQTANAISTPKGGTHVSHVEIELLDSLISKAKREAGKGEIKPVHVKKNLWVFINCLIENPAYRGS